MFCKGGKINLRRIKIMREDYDYMLKVFEDNSYTIQTDLGRWDKGMNINSMKYTLDRFFEPCDVESILDIYKLP